MVQEVGPCVMNEVSKLLLCLCGGVEEVRQLLKLDCRGELMEMLVKKGWKICDVGGLGDDGLNVHGVVVEGEN